MTPLPSWAEKVRLLYPTKVKGQELLIKTCPYCHNARWNFQVSLTKAIFHCWVCNVAGSVKKFLYLAGIEFEEDDIQIRSEKKEDKELKYPQVKPLIFEQSRTAAIARSYLNGRGVTDEMIKEFDVGLATGEDKDALGMNYFGYVIIPFYGLNGLEYFVGANFLGKGYKYLLPDVDKDRWCPINRGSRKMVIVEGLFDMWTVWKYTDYDVMMLFGKFLRDKQTEMLKRVGYDIVYACLDGDAPEENRKLAKRLYKEGNTVFLVSLPAEHDPNSLGENIKEYIHKAEPFTDITFVTSAIKAIAHRGAL